MDDNWTRVEAVGTDGKEDHEFHRADGARVFRGLPSTLWMLMHPGGFEVNYPGRSVGMRWALSSMSMEYADRTIPIAAPEAPK